MIRRIVALSALSVVAFAPAAFAAPQHKEQADGCDHGATSKPCKDDPQPDRGKDCELHGRHGGVNEDHCAGTSTTTTTLIATTTTTTPAQTGTPVTTSTTAAGPSTSAPSGSSGGGSLTPYLGCVTPEGHPYLTNIERGGCPAPTGAPEPAPTPGVATALSELPATGAASTFLLLLGLWFVGGGLCALAMGWAMRSLNDTTPAPEEDGTGVAEAESKLDASGDSILQHHWSAWDEDTITATSTPITAAFATYEEETK